MYRACACIVAEDLVPVYRNIGAGGGGEELQGFYGEGVGNMILDVWHGQIINGVQVFVNHMF